MQNPRRIQPSFASQKCEAMASQLQASWYVMYIIIANACIFNPWRMRCRVTVVVLCLSVCLSVCVSVTTLAATYLVNMSKVRQYTVSCGLLQICIVWTSLKTFCSGDMAPFAYHNDQRLGSFSIKNTPMVLDTIRNGTVHEPLGRSNDYLN